MSSDATYSTRQYIFDVRQNARLRTSITIANGRTVEFAVQLECEIAANDWRAVARFDTTGGKAHRDKLTVDGDYRTHRESIKLGSDLDTQLKNARNDLFKNCDKYLDEFLK